MTVRFSKLAIVSIVTLPIIASQSGFAAVLATALGSSGMTTAGTTHGITSVAPVKSFASGALLQSAITAATTAAATSTIVTKTIDLKSNSAWSTPSIIQMQGGLGIKVKGVISYSTIGPIEIIGAKQSVYFDTAAVVRNLDISNLTVTNTLREGIRIQGDVNGVTVKNFSLKQAATPTIAPDLPTGIAIHKGTNIQISDGTASGFQMVTTGYPNGDGISAEGAVSNLTISRVKASDNSDGGFDLKSSNTALYDLTAERNYRNYRFWSSVKAGTLTSVDPSNAHVWAGSGADVVIDNLIVSSTTKAVVLYVDGAKSLTIKACQLKVPAGTKLMYKATPSSVVTLGPGCAL